jgi:hypothetical protein
MNKTEPAELSPIMKWPEGLVVKPSNRTFDDYGFTFTEAQRFFLLVLKNEKSLAILKVQVSIPFHPTFFTITRHRTY